MTTDELDRRCEALGIALSYHDIWGELHATPEATKRALVEAMHADDAPAPGDVQVARGARCHMPPPGARLFGPAIQLHALRSLRNWGVGDFTDLATLAQIAAAQGASFVGVNPLHELFLDRPAQASPYSPSTRLALNPLYIDVEAVDGFDAVRALATRGAFAQRIAALRATPLIDYAGVWAAKREVLVLLFEHFERAATVQSREAFRAFAAEQHEAVRDAALFDALQAHLSAHDANVWGWPAWPDAYRQRDGASVAAFEREHARSIEFHLFLQWQADVQLARAHAAARDAGMSIGIYRDLAVGANPGGAETWQDPRLFAEGVHVGAPPDDFNRKGQDWGLPPWIPNELRLARYEPFVKLVRANMRHAGALRIDHVMGLARLYWIPRGMSPEDGAYVRYPLDDLCAALAGESARQRCLVVGEDLGTVPDSLRETLRDAGVFSYRVLYFERTADGAFAPPAAYPTQALVSVSTHDLPTLRGFLGGTDLAHRARLSLFPSEALRDRLYAERDRDRAALDGALASERVADDDIAVAVHRYAARTPCTLMTVQLEDVFGEAEQANLPATLEDQHPNWRRKVGLDLEDWDRDGRFARLCAAIRGEGRGA
ncbi:MAG: 4-alpha-glucanotransferase [Burkholderiales bacterium]